MSSGPDRYESNWASTLGHPCFRYLYLKRTAPKLEIISEEKKALFKKGCELEEVVINEFKKDGFEIIELQKKFELKELKIVGKIDCIIRYRELEYPCEIKSVSENLWGKIYTYNDFLNSSYYYIRMYPLQLQLYLYATSKESGYFYLRNKITSSGRFVKVKFDNEMVKDAFDKAKKINKYVDENILPAKISDLSICEDCGFYNYCYK
ncbi:MAG: hypothetical protein ACK4NF_02135 [Planctomycetota bacterium]